MAIIGGCFQCLHSWAENFSLGPFSEILKPDVIKQALIDAKVVEKRKRKLPSVLVVWLLIGMGLYRTLSIENVLRKVGNILGEGSIWKDGILPKSSSIVAARDRVGLEPYLFLLRFLAQSFIDRFKQLARYRDFLLVALDGSTFKVADSPENRDHFGLPGSSRGNRAAYPQARAMFAVSPRTHFIFATNFAPYHVGEMTLAHEIVPQLPRESLVLLDRGFNCWTLLHALQERGCEILLRACSNLKTEFMRQLGPGDTLVRVRFSAKSRRRDPDLPKHFSLRMIEVLVNGQPRCYLTTLYDADEYPAAELAELYTSRWEAEVVLDAIKTHQAAASVVNRPLVMRCLLPHRVKQEFYGVVVAYNLIRTLMTESADLYEIDPLRISFVGALERIRDAVLLMAAAAPWKILLIRDDLLLEIARCILLPRRDRHYPREVCIKMSPFKKKDKPGLPEEHGQC